MAVKATERCDVSYFEIRDRNLVQLFDDVVVVSVELENTAVRRQ